MCSNFWIKGKVYPIFRYFLGWSFSLFYFRGKSLIKSFLNLEMLGKNDKAFIHSFSVTTWEFLLSSKESYLKKQINFIIWKWGEEFLLGEKALQNLELQMEKEIWSQKKCHLESITVPK